jgi:hypothetical protein
MSFARAVQALRLSCHRFDAEGHEAKRLALQRLACTGLQDTRALLRYYEMLLFLRAHPSDAALLAQVEGEFGRMARFLGQRRRRRRPHLENTGLPFTDTVTRFSHDCVRWLLGHARCRVAPDSYGEPQLDLNAVLRLTLPTLERSQTTAGFDNEELLDALKVPRSKRLAFIVNELSRFDGQPYVKDQLFDSLDLYVRVTPSDRSFSKAYNRLPMATVHYQAELLRRFDHRALMNRRLPAARVLDAPGRAQAVEVVRNSLALTGRETDPGTYVDPDSLRIFDVEHGLSVAIYGMAPARQLPLESYVGFTLFKNGLAAAYGGAWVLGPRSNFGMNIFEPYRGGESGFMMCQVLRVYRQAFGVDFFEVEAQQFGLDNADGIASGAFWFYYRHGFRPLDTALAKLAEQERLKITRRPGYRSSEKTLLRFTGSNVALNFGTAVPMQLADITSRVTRLVQARYGGDRRAAERDCMQRFASRASRASLPRRPSENQLAVLAEVAMVAEALAIDAGPRLDALRRMVRAKPADLQRYQGMLLAFFAGA